MKHDIPSTAEEEMSVLIMALREADAQLELLTAGEIDTVADREGNSFTLQRAQSQLRFKEVAKQAAILNALPAHIALLDEVGRIVSVNEAWRQFAEGNGLGLGNFGIGTNYLRICDEAAGTAAIEAHQVSAGIRSVLSGEVGHFASEYCCDSPTEARFFLLTVTPLAADRPRGAVVMHLNISEQKRGEDALKRFGAAMNATADAIFLIDRATMSAVYVNEAGSQMHGRALDGPFVLEPWRVQSTSSVGLESLYDDLIRIGIPALPVEVLWQRSDGSRVWLEVRRHAQRLGGQWVIVILARDVTDRKYTQGRINQLNRVLAMRSGINALMMRAHNRKELFRDVCRTAVEDGGLRASLIGNVDPGNMIIVPLATFGADEQLMAAIKEDLVSEGSDPSSMVIRAITEKAASVLDNFGGASAAVFVQARADFGIRSVALLPLIVEGNCVAVLILFATEKNFFHEEEMKLLQELADDVAFTIDHIAKAEKLSYLAYYDELTGLANRTLFIERTTHHLLESSRLGHKAALFLIDLERFKNINDTLGRESGDILLRQAAQWLTDRVGSATLLSRLNADHFAVIMPRVNEEGDLMRLIEKMMVAFLNHPFYLRDGAFRVAAKVGVAVFPNDGRDAETLVKNAEAALKRAKATKARYLFYTQKMTAAVAGRLVLENQLRQAVESEEFVLHYQPKVSLASGKVTGAEALIRWNDPRSGLVPPSQFIPILEETGLIHDVGRWALRKAIADYLRWVNSGLVAVRIAVNVSPLQLRDRGFVSEVEQAIGVDVRAAAGMQLEITESLIMEDVKHSIESLRKIRIMGMSVAIDDFGTGFSSLSYLSKLPIDTLKIDRSFVSEMTSGPDGLALVTAVINLAHSLKLTVVAEGVESEDQASLLRLLKCDEMQGFLFSKAVPCETFEARYLGGVPQHVGYGR